MLQLPRRRLGLKVRKVKRSSGTFVVVLRVGYAWLVGVGKRAPHGFQCPCLVSPHGSLDRLNSLFAFFSLQRILKDRHNRPRHGSAA